MNSKTAATSILRKLLAKPNGGFGNSENIEVLSRLAHSGQVGVLRALWRELQTRPNKYRIESGVTRVVLDAIEESLGFHPGFEQAQALVDIHLEGKRYVSEEQRHDRSIALASLVASRQPKRVLLALVREYLGVPGAFEMLAAMAQEGVVRKRFTVGDFSKDPLSSLVREMCAQEHPLALLPLELSDVERELEPRSYSRNGSSASFPWLEDDRFEAGQGVAPTGDALSFDEVTGTEEKRRIGSAVWNWARKSNGLVEARVFTANTLLSSKIITSGSILSLDLASLANCSASDLTVFEVPASKAASILFAACAHGGAYSSGVFSSYGRLGMWKSLLGLAGINTDNFMNGLASVEACQWFYFAARGGWFQQIAWDFGLLVLRPDKRTVACLAATDTD